MFDRIMKVNANAKRKATFRKRPPDGSKLRILANARNSKEKPNNRLYCGVKFTLKNTMEINITLQ